jgi:hypothetical protein
MQSLGLSPHSTKTENRLKTLFWPSVRFETDADLLSRQGFWVCCVIAVGTLIVSFLRASSYGSILSVFFFLGGLGSRQRSRFAAVVILVVFLVSFLGGLSVVNVIFTGLLVGNVRAAWLSSKWPHDKTVTDQRLRAQIHQTLGDKLVDRLPPYLWPKMKWLFYILAAIEVIGVLMLLANRI